MITLTFNFK